MYTWQVEKQKKIVKQLSIEMSGLKDELSNTEFNLQNTLLTNDGLTNEIKQLRQESTGLGEAVNAAKILEEINASLLKEQESWSCKEVAYKETIESLTRNLEALNAELTKVEEAWENKKTEYEQTIASLNVDLELCQC